VFTQSGTTSPLVLLIYSTLSRNRATFKPLSGNLNQINQVGCARAAAAPCSGSAGLPPPLPTPVPLHPQVTGVSSADQEGDPAQPNGGAVFMSGAVLQTALCVMDDNQAANSGGAMYLQDACSLVGGLLWAGPGRAVRGGRGGAASGLGWAAALGSCCAPATAAPPQSRPATCAAEQSP
jgi:hypothetical protein